MSSRALPAVPFLLLSSCLLANAVHAAGQATAPSSSWASRPWSPPPRRKPSRRRGFHHHRRGHRQATAEQRPVADHPDHAGVNLTGNSSSGQRGNNRQIDIRGMGPENTLILVDGKPVSSRNSVRYGWRGERDSRGDTNWVPADQVERASK